jgi:hypothetical protein
MQLSAILRVISPISEKGADICLRVSKQDAVNTVQFFRGEIVEMAIRPLDP